MDNGTSAEVIVVTLAAAAAALYAFWVSILRGRAIRGLVRWIRDQHPEIWEALPRLTRASNIIGAIEQLRRQQFGEDPEFLSRYAEGKRYARRQIIFVLIGMVLIGVLFLGLRYLGWRW